MKKIKLITRHAYPNYGSLLQAHALQHTINNLGYYSEYVNYIPKDEIGHKLAFKGLNTSSYITSPIKKLLYLLVQIPNFTIMYSKFNKFNNILKKDVQSDVICEKTFEGFDVAMVGSDQVWNKIMGNYDFNYFLNLNLGNTIRKISYASSFGTSRLDENYENEIIKYLNDFDDITVREIDAVEMLSKKGICARHVIDPVLLQDNSYWDSFADISKLKLNNYILVYQLHNTKDFEYKLRKLHELTGKKIIRVSNDIKQFFMYGNLKYLVTPNDFLKLIKNSDLVITDSFHGTLFSIIFNKNFFTIMPNENRSRLNSILGQLRLENRIYEEIQLNEISKEIEYDQINEKLRSMRKESINILAEIIEGKK